MDAKTDCDWKQKVGFPINYDSEDSSSDGFDTKDVVFRNPRASSRYLLADGGDGSEADLLGSTPPRSRIRDKEKRRNVLDSCSPVSRAIKEKRDVVDNAVDPVSERFRKRASQKLLRSKERDWKLDTSYQEKADSLPSPNPVAAVPTLLKPPIYSLHHHQVESCSRFMSLTSRPKCRADVDDLEPEDQWDQEQSDQLPASRVTFHKTFSMLINMGNVEKGCRRTISREEQVWQNELKDLIWLELQAKIAGRTLAQQDMYLCSQRKIVPTVINNILEYNFIDNNPCRKKDMNGSQETPADGDETDSNTDENAYCCPRFDCQACTDRIGQAMREVYTLLEAYYGAVSLYPSTRAMIECQPAVDTPAFENRLKALCLWYNIAVLMRVKMLTVRYFLRSLKKFQKDRRRKVSHDVEITSVKQDVRKCQVRFTTHDGASAKSTPTDSSNSDSSHKEEEDKQDGQPKEEEKQESREGEDDKIATPATPEVVLDSYSSTNTTDTLESGYTSGVEFTSESVPKDCDWDVYNTGSFADLAKMRLLDRNVTPLFKLYYQESLKTQGFRRSISFLKTLRKETLVKVLKTLEKPNTIPEADETDQVDGFQDHKNGNKVNQEQAKIYELKRYGCWSTECTAMKLPSYRSHFLLLNALCLEAIHGYLEFRLEVGPEAPSCLTVKQLLHDLKEGLDTATELRVDFLRNVDSALPGRKDAAPQLLQVARAFDDSIETTLKLYLSYLTLMSEKEDMSRGALQAEWCFAVRLARRIPCAQILAPPAFSKIACNQLDLLVKNMQEEFDSMKKEQEDELNYDMEEDGEPIDKMQKQKRDMLVVLRTAQCIYARGGARARGAAAWARALAARTPPDNHNHNIIFNSLMGLRDFITQQVQEIYSKSEALQPDHENHDVISGRVRELLLQICKLGFELHRELYQFACGPIPTQTIGRDRVSRPVSLQPPQRKTRPRPRPGTMIVNDTFNPVLNDKWVHKELHQLVHEGINRSASPPRALQRTISTRPRPFVFLRADSVLDDTEERGEHVNHFGDAQPHRTGFELLMSPSPDEVELRFPARAQRCAWAGRVARAVVDFAKFWMKFVLQRCDRGRGLRPRWASQGLEFLMLACDPCNTKHLSDEEFEELKQLMDGCISHVIGSRPSADATPSPRPRHRLHSPMPSTTSSRENLTPPTPMSETDPMQNYEETDNNRSERVLQALQMLEDKREEQLVEERRVGKVLRAPAPAYRHKLRQLNFKWQRGLKIGAGSFGKVYTVVNIESGQLLAMKELNIGAADRRAFQRAANELQVLEGVIHPHLVRYYGCEMHREEMLIFMELCVEGCLEALVATSGALTELTVRRYTKQLVSAVHALHSRNIAHRDIKSGNIFLTNEGHCLKLGDFGCAVKIRANTTAPNELQGFVGTQAYMAPEVFMKASGHGRAADIWSIGCVVTEMASGKRPFAEYDSNYQIMFMVGMGARPTPPASLSGEGHEFCGAALTHEPAHRPSAHDLMSHTFLLVKSDDDCKCEPSYLIT